MKHECLLCDLDFKYVKSGLYLYWALFCIYKRLIETDISLKRKNVQMYYESLLSSVYCMQIHMFLNTLIVINTNMAMASTIGLHLHTFKCWKSIGAKFCYESTKIIYVIFLV
jgi:hypothetical protein